MPRLGRNRLQRLALCITGDGDLEAFPYRRHVDLDEFFAAFAEVNWEDPDASRYERTLRFLGACNQGELAASGLPEAIQRVVEYVLSLGEFDDSDQQKEALSEMGDILNGYRVKLEPDPFGDIKVQSEATDKRQEVLDAELHTAFGDVLHESDLRVARVHYKNARRLLESDDFPNSAKEAVCSVEAYLRALTGEADLKRALRRANQGGVPKPLDGVIEKLYAWRGNEPGVAHAGDEPPSVTFSDAKFALNLAAAINLYLREKLVRTDALDP